MPNAPVTVYSGQRVDPAYDAENMFEIPGGLNPSTVYPKGTIVAESVAHPGTYGPYVAAGGDGMLTPKGILRYACSTDAVAAPNTNITVPGENGMTRNDIMIAVVGTFYTTDLVGLDAGGLTASGWRLVSGTLANGVIRLQ